MHGYNLLITLGGGSLVAFATFFVFYKALRWHGKMAALATAALMLLLLVPLSISSWQGLDVFAIHFAFYMMVPYGLGIITNVHEERRIREGKEIEKGMHWIPGIIIVFFILLAVVDSVIILFATNGVSGTIAKLVLPDSLTEDAGPGRQSKFVGTIAHNFQDKEVEFDKYVAELREQKKRGWQVLDGWESTPIAGQDSAFNLRVLSKTGEPIVGGKTIIEFLRTSGMDADQTIELKEGKPGHYESLVNLSAPGCWLIRITITRGDEKHEVKGDTEVAELVDGKVVPRPCAIGEPDMD